MLAYDLGSGLKCDSKKAHQLWLECAELSSRNADSLGARNALYNLYRSYSDRCMERVVEKDVQKAMYHLKMAVINGDGRSKCFLAKYEMKIGNIERAKTHWMISFSMECDTCMQIMAEGYKERHITEDEYSKTSGKE